MFYTFGDNFRSFRGLLEASWRPLGGFLVPQAPAQEKYASRLWPEAYFLRNHALTTGESTNSKVRQTLQIPGRQQHVLPATGFSMCVSRMCSKPLMGALISTSDFNELAAAG